MAGMTHLPVGANRRKNILRDFTFWRPIIIALGILALAVFGIVFLPKLWNMPLPEKATKDPYATYRALYTEVKEYGFAHGPDPELEQKIKKALSMGSGDPGGYYFYLMAAAEYYYGAGDYERALAFATDAELDAPTDKEYEEVLLFYIKTYRKMGDTENLNYYQKQYDDFTYEPENCEDEETNNEQ